MDRAVVKRRGMTSDRCKGKQSLNGMVVVVVVVVVVFVFSNSRPLSLFSFSLLSFLFSLFSLFIFVFCAHSTTTDTGAFLGNPISLSDARTLPIAVE